MSFLLLGIDSLIAGAAVCLVVRPQRRLLFAALFGVADAVGFLIGAGLGWQLSAGVTEVLETGTVVALGLWLLVVAAGTHRAAALWPVWVLPFALTLDNLAFGLVSDPSAGSLFQQAGEQGLSSALLALVGVVGGAFVLRRALPALERRAAALQLAGGGLVLAAGGLALLG